MQRTDATPAKFYGFKMISPFDEVGNNQPAKLSATVAFRKTLNSEVAPALIRHHKSRI